MAPYFFTEIQADLEGLIKYHQAMQLLAWREGRLDDHREECWMIDTYLLASYNWGTVEEIYMVYGDLAKIHDDDIQLETDPPQG